MNLLEEPQPECAANIQQKQLCAAESQRWYGLKTERRDLEDFNKSKITSRYFSILWKWLYLLFFQNTLTSGCISSPVLHMGNKAEMLSDYTDTKNLQSAEKSPDLSSGQLDTPSSHMSRFGKLPRVLIFYYHQSTYTLSSYCQKVIGQIRLTAPYWSSPIKTH